MTNLEYVLIVWFPVYCKACFHRGGRARHYVQARVQARVQGCVQTCAQTCEWACLFHCFPNHRRVRDISAHTSMHVHGTCLHRCPCKCLHRCPYTPLHACSRHVFAQLSMLMSAPAHICRPSPRARESSQSTAPGILFCSEKNGGRHGATDPRVVSERPRDVSLGSSRDASLGPLDRWRPPESAVGVHRDVVEEETCERRRRRPPRVYTKSACTRLRTCLCTWV